MTVSPELETTFENLRPKWSVEQDSATPGLGQKTCPVRHQSEYTCGLVAILFAGSVDADRHNECRFVGSKCRS